LLKTPEIEKKNKIKQMNKNLKRELMTKEFF